MARIWEYSQTSEVVIAILASIILYAFRTVHVGIDAGSSPSPAIEAAYRPGSPLTVWPL
jgi:hypothetical protein